MTSFKAPEPFLPGPQPALAWEEYKERYLIYASAAKLDKEVDKHQINVFLHVLGKEGHRIYKTLKITVPVDTRKLTDIFEAFDKYYKPYRSTSFSRYKFFTTKQSPHQTFDQFLTELKTIAPGCGFAELQDSLIATQIFIGTNNEEVRKKLIQIDSLTLQEAITVAQAEETSSANVQTMSSARRPQTGDAPTEHLDELTRNRNRYNPPRSDFRQRATSEGRRFNNRQQYAAPQRTRSYEQLSTNQEHRPRRPSCLRCGLSHLNRTCPAQGSRCRTCGVMGHWAKTCRSIRTLDETPTYDEIPPSWRDDRFEEHEETQLTENNYDESLDALYLQHLTIFSTAHDDPADTHEDTIWHARLQVYNQKLTFKIDTGSQVNVISERFYHQIPDKPPLRKPIHSVRAYSGHTVPIIGITTLECKSEATSVKTLFYVTPYYATPILSGKTSLALKLITRLPHNVESASKKLNTINQTSVTHKTQIKTPTVHTDNQELLQQTPQEIVAAYQDVFNKIGKLPGKHELRLKPNATHSISAARRIPIKLRQPVQDELNRMHKEGIIEPVHEPTDWVHPMVVVRKSSGTLRICIDPRNLNKALVRHAFVMPTAQEIYANLSGSRIFTVLDAQSAFWQIQLTEESSRICTFATPFGRYRFKRLPYGIAIASELFQQTMHQIFGDIPQVHISTDDFVIHGPDTTSHNKGLLAVLNRARETGLAFSTDKMQLGVLKITYLGNIVSNKGLQIHPSKVQAITELPPPVDKTALQRFLGMVNYLAKFIPAYSERTAPLRELLKSCAEYQWDHNLQLAYDDIKKAISSAPVLQFFDPNAPILISVDASQHGIGAVLLQNGHPIEYASMTFNPTQQRYAQIEKEYLAILYACERFHFYVATTSFTVETDHRPLLAIIKKPFHLMSPRLQRLTLRLARYDPILTYVPGTKLYVADTLSRAPQSTSSYDTNYLEGPNAGVYSLTTMSGDRENKFRTETEADKTMQQVVKYCKNGWPTNRSVIRDQEILQFWPIQEELHEEEGLLYRGDRLVVPRTLQKYTMEQLHVIHQGTTACIAKARVHVYWPNMTRDITHFIKECAICRQHDPANTATPLQPLSVPPGPWHTVGSDLFHHKGRNMILLVDYFSKFIEVQQLPSTTAQAAISFLAPLIARYGIPNQLISDNGPPYNSAEFKSFLNKWGIEHTTSSPYHPQTNGLSERSVQTMKNLLNKAEADGRDLNQVLLEYRTTPKENLPSPAEILMGRKLRTPITTNQKSLTPQYSIAETSQILHQKQQKMIQQANRRPNKQLKPLPRRRQSMVHGWIKKMGTSYHHKKQWVRLVYHTNTKGQRIPKNENTFTTGTPKIRPTTTRRSSKQNLITIHHQQHNYQKSQRKNNNTMEPASNQK